MKLLKSFDKFHRARILDCKIVKVKIGITIEDLKTLRAEYKSPLKLFSVVRKAKTRERERERDREAETEREAERRE